VSQLYEESSENKKLRDLSEMKKDYLKCEVSISLPYQMTLEHLELQINQRYNELFKKYMTLLSIEVVNNERSEQLISKSGFYDNSKR
jgi:endonuclease III